ncbi:MAG: N-acetyltransferase [Elainellaceae cyanobacterium]
MTSITQSDDWPANTAMPKQETLYILPMSCDRHPTDAIASLIYASAPALFNLMFGPKQWAIHRLSALIERPNNRFSHRHIRVAEVDHSAVGASAVGVSAVGMIVMLPADQLKSTADYRDAFGLSQGLWLTLLQRLLLRHLLRHDYPAGSFYIGNLAVASDHRNRGIGHQLLSQCISEASPAEIFISVDVDNPRAQKLYESLGFQAVDTKTIRVLDTTIGSRILSLNALGDVA